LICLTEENALKKARKKSLILPTHSLSAAKQSEDKLSNVLGFPFRHNSIPSQGLRIEFESGTAEYVGDLSKTPWITESRHVIGGGWLLHTPENQEPEVRVDTTLAWCLLVVWCSRS
jgi:hypothetical protein